MRLHGGASDPEHDDVYDQELAIAVQNFQREHRLNVDGIAGMQTQVVLDTALAEPGSPLLLHNAHAARLGIPHVLHPGCTEEVRDRTPAPERSRSDGFAGDRDPALGCRCGPSVSCCCSDST